MDENKARLAMSWLVELEMGRGRYSIFNIH